MSGTSRSSSNRSTPWRSSSLASPTASLSIIVAEPEQGSPLRSARDSPTPSTSLPPSYVPQTSAPVSIPAPQSCRSSSSEGSPPPFVSDVPKTPPPASPQGSPTDLSPSKPTLASSPDDPVLSMLLPGQRTSTPKSQPPNSSHSRFTISLPLLGRAKVPLDTVLSPGEGRNRQVPVVAHKDSSRISQMPPIPDSSTVPSTPSSSPFVPPLVPPQVQPATLTTPNQSVESDANGARDSPSISKVETTTTTTSATTTSALTIIDKVHPDKPNDSTNSWWNYVGWNSTSPLTPSAAALVSIESSETQELKSATPSTNIDAQLTTCDASAPTVTVSGPVESGLVNEIEVGTSVEPAIEGEKEGSDQQVSSPMWYARWGWYSSNGPIQPESEGLGAKTISEDVQIDVPAQDPDPEPTSVASPEGHEGDAPSDPINPLTTSIEVNWGSWASFFSSRKFMVKTLGYGVNNIGEDVKRDENGMEIMDVDDDDEQGGKDVMKDGRGQVSLSVTPNPVVETKPILLKASNSRDNVSSRIDLRSSHSTRELSPATPQPSSSPTKPSVSSTPKTGNSGSNTPLPFPPLPPSPSPSSREKSRSPSSSNTPSTSMSTRNVSNQRTTSPAPSKNSVSSPPPPNLVLPTWQQTFHTAPRNVVPATVKPRSMDDQGVGGKLLGKTMKFVSGVLFARDANDGSLDSGKKMKGKEREMGGDSAEDREVKRREAERFKEFGKELPKPWQIFEEAGLHINTTPKTTISSFGFYSPKSTNKGSQVGVGASEGEGSPSDGMKDVLRGCKKVVIIGIHGWFPGAMLRTVVGEPTGTSTKFANMTEQALQQFEDEHGVKLEKITKIPLEGDGTIEKRVDRLYHNLKSNEDWMTELHEADAIIVSTHSQGSIVSTHLLNQLIQDNHITTARNHPLTMGVGTGAETFPSAIGAPETVSRKSKAQRVCCVALCGTHLGPLRYLSSSTLVGPYIQYFESTAARELFEFQNTESAVSKAYVQALQNVLDHGIKMLYIASLNDQVVPIYSGLFTAVSHPLILRALYIDGDAYHSSDFLSILLVLLLRILNSGISDSGLIAHLSEATAGSLIGVGHSTAYEELSTFSLAVKYLFLANEGMPETTELRVEPFNASQEQNDYEIPWSLRDIIADERVSHYFSRDIAELRDGFREWHPKTSILRDLKRKLQPITRLPSSSTFNSLGSGMSKL